MSRRSSSTVNSSNKSSRIIPHVITRTNNSGLSRSGKANRLPPPPATNPNPTTNPTTASTSGSSTTPSIMSTMLNGFSFGIGQSIAHNSVNRIFNWGGNNNNSGNSISPNPINKSCEDLNKQLTECLDFNGNSHITCESVIKAYELCLNESK